MMGRGEKDAVAMETMNMSFAYSKPPVLWIYMIGLHFSHI